jgi:flagellar protein FliT
VDITAEYAAAMVISQRMLAAARTGDWDELVQLETQRAGMIDRVRKLEGNASPVHHPELDTIIRQILSCDDEIQQLVKPWMAEASEILSSLQAARKLQKAYK